MHFPTVYLLCAFRNHTRLSRLCCTSHFGHGFNLQTKKIPISLIALQTCLVVKTKWCSACQSSSRLESDLEIVLVSYFSSLVRRSLCHCSPMRNHSSQCISNHVYRTDEALILYDARVQNVPRQQDLCTIQTPLYKCLREYLQPKNWYYVVEQIELSRMVVHVRSKEINLSMPTRQRVWKPYVIGGTWT